MLKINIFQYLYVSFLPHFSSSNHEIWYFFQCCGSGAFLTPGSGLEKNPDPGSAINIPDHISKILVTITLGVKVFIFFFTDPESEIRCLFDHGSGMEKCRSEIWDKNHGSVTLFSFLRVKNQESESGFEHCLRYRSKLSVNLYREVQYTVQCPPLFIILVFQTYREILTYRTLWCPFLCKTEDVMTGLAQPGS